LGDENDEVKNTAWDEWEAAGDIFLDENLEEYRSHVDFPKPPPPNFKEGGCSIQKRIRRHAIQFAIIYFNPNCCFY